MQVAITSRHGNINGEAREHITRKSEKLLTYFERVTEIDVTVDFQRDRIKVEMLVDAEHKHNFVASDEGELVTATFDGALQKMEQQIRRYKQKLQDHRRNIPMSEFAESEMAESESESD